MAEGLKLANDIWVEIQSQNPQINLNAYPTVLAVLSFLSDPNNKVYWGQLKKYVEE